MIAPITSSQPISIDAGVSQNTAQTVTMGQMLAAQEAVSRPEHQRAVNQTKDPQKSGDHTVKGSFVEQGKEQAKQEQNRVQRRLHRQEGRQQQSLQETSPGKKGSTPLWFAPDAEFVQARSDRPAPFRRRAQAPAMQARLAPQTGQPAPAPQAPAPQAQPATMVLDWFGTRGPPRAAEQRAGQVSQLWQGIQASQLAESAPQLIGKTVVVAQLASGLAKFQADNDDRMRESEDRLVERALTAYADSLKTARPVGSTASIFDQTLHRLVA